MALMGVDAGMTGVKAVVFDENGKILSSAYREYPMHYPRRGWSEFEGGELWGATSAVIAEAAGAAGEAVTALVISSMGEAAVPVGRDGAALAPAISSVDGRAAEIAAAFEERFGRQRLFELTGAPPHNCYTVNQVLWLKANKPEIFKNVWKFLQIEDFLGYRLTGETVVDYSLASRTALFDVTKAVWCEELFAELELSPEIFSRPVQSGTPVGKVLGAVADELNLPADVVVAAGGHDQPMCALGAGAVTDGTADLSLGTVECLTNAHLKPVLKPEVLASNFPVYRHVAPDRFVSLAYNFTSGSLLRWYRDNFAKRETAAAEAAGRNVYEVLFEGMPDRLTPVIVLPHHSGTGTPYLDPAARGAILNLDLATDTAEIFLACAQGPVLELMHNFSTLEKCGLAPRTINAIGGGARSSKWLQMRADALGVPINKMDVEEAGCAGAAILAGVGTGQFRDVEEGISAFVRVGETIEPREERRGEWGEVFERYRGLYEALKPFRL